MREDEIRVQEMTEKEQALTEKELELKEQELIEQKPDYAEEICGIIRSAASAEEMAEKLGDYHEVDIAEALSMLTAAERKKFYRAIEGEDLADIMDFADEEDAAAYLAEMDVKSAAEVVNSMDADTAADALEEMDEHKRKQIIALTDEDTKEEIKLLNSFDEEEIGSKMTTNFIVVKRGMTVKQAMNALIEQAPENDNISTLFVEDEDGVFYGAIDLRELIIARENTDLEDIIRKSYPYVYGSEEIDDCIEKLKDYYEDLIPVLDADNKLIGVITSQGLVEVVDDEMGEDYVKLAGVIAEEDLEESVIESMKKRLPWLIILLFLGLGVSTVVGLFEPVIASLALIVAFQSLVLDMAGNVGTQSLAVTVRFLTDENLTREQRIKHVLKEAKVGLIDGILMGSAAAIFVGFYIYFFKGGNAEMAFSVSYCMGLAMLVAMIFSSTVGALIPLFFDSIDVDPAVASGPLISTINDLVAVVTYYGLAWLLLIKVAHLGG